MTTQTPAPSFPWKLILLALLCGAAGYYLPHSAGGKEPVHWVSIEEGEKEWQKGQKPILYDFCAAWCGPCNAMKEQVFYDQATADKINEFFIPVRVLDRSREDGRNPDEIQALDVKYNIHYFPTLVVRMQGDQPQIQEGYGGPGPTVKFLQGALALWNQAQSSASHP